MRHFTNLALIALVAMAFVAGPTVAKPGKAWLGVYTQSVDNDMARAFDLPVEYGAIINSIVDDSPADEYGLEEDDIIIAANDERVADDEALIRIIGDAHPGDDITLTVMRGDREREIEVELGRRGESRSSSRTYSWSGGPRSFSYSYDGDSWFHHGHGLGYLGVYLTDLSPEAAKALGAKRGGVLIDDIEEDSPAEIAGLRAGDIIVTINGEEIQESEDLTDVVSEMHEGDTADVTVIRAGQQESIAVEVGEHDPEVLIFGPQGLRIPKVHVDVPNVIVDIDEDEVNRELRNAMRELRENMKELRLELKDLRRRVD